MVVVGPKHFYVFEFARLDSGQYVVPERWVRYKSEMHGEVFRVTFDDHGIASIDDSATVRVKVTDLCDTFLDLSACSAVPRCDGKLFDLAHGVARTNHHLRDINHKICQRHAQSRSDSC